MKRLGFSSKKRGAVAEATASTFCAGKRSIFIHLRLAVGKEYERGLLYKTGVAAQKKPPLSQYSPCPRKQNPRRSWLRRGGLAVCSGPPVQTPHDYCRKLVKDSPTRRIEAW
jgi:hypothetical protein